MDWTYFDFIFQGQNFKWFSWFGLVLVMLPMLPDILFGMQPQNNKPANLKNSHVTLVILESLSKIIYIVMLILLRYEAKQSIVLLGIIVVALMGYYYMWYSYFADGCNYPDIFTKKLFGIPLPMTLLPIIYFLAVSIWLQNYPALVSALIFGVCHIINSNIMRKQF